MTPAENKAREAVREATEALAREPDALARAAIHRRRERAWKDLSDALPHDREITDALLIAGKSDAQEAQTLEELLNWEVGSA